ncbi:unnamed protein product [Caenorhabditis nigoni]
MNFEAGHRPTASLSIEAKRARNRMNTRNYQMRKRQEKEELEEDVKILENEFSRIFGEDALKELKHGAQQSEIKAPDELQMQIQDLEDELEDIARRRGLPGTNLMTNASQKSRANTALKIAKLKVWKIVLVNELKELEAELAIDPPRTEAYGSSAAIKTNSADDRSYSTQRCPNLSFKCPLKAAQNTENVDFADMPDLERQEESRTAEESSSGAATDYQKCPKRLLERLQHDSYNFSEKQENTLDVDVIDGSPTANTGISTNVNSETTKRRQRRHTINSYRIEDRLHLAPSNKRQRTDVSGGTINLFDDHVIYNDPKIPHSPSPLHTGTLHNLTSTEQVLEGHSKAGEGSSNDAVRSYISNNSHSNTHGGWHNGWMNSTAHHYPHDRDTATENHDFFEEDRCEPSRIEIRSPPRPFNNPPQCPVSPTEQFFEDHSVDVTWNRAGGPSPSPPPTRPLNNSSQVPVSPTEQLFEDHSVDGKWNRALEPSPASSFGSGELAEDYWELDCSAPTNDAGSPTQDRLEPDWSPAMEPDPTATTATETAQEGWDHWTADEQEL